MRTRTILFLVGAVLLGAVVLGGTGIALAWGHGGNMPWAAAPMGSTPGEFGYGPMMGSNGHGSMMGPNGYGYGPGSMMHGQYGATPPAQQASQASPAVGVTQVQIANFAFTPANLQVSAGTTVTWTNQDTAPHTVTFRTSVLKSSGILRQSESFTATFTMPGTYAYYCAVHPHMTAQVVVIP